LKGSERSAKKKKEKSPNPFGDDSDDDDDENPFGKDSDDEGSESNPFGSSTRSSKRSFSSTISKASSRGGIVQKPPQKKYQFPLHTVASRGYYIVLNALLDRNVDLNKADSCGNTAMHLSIIYEHKDVTEMLIDHRNINLRLQNNDGLTPFATALRVKNTKAAERILDKEPTTAEQYDRLGRNFLHLAINEKDTESVLFLIQVRVDVNSRTKDGEEATPLHLAVKIGDDFIVRNLTLAGAEVDAVDKTGQTALHCAAERDLAEITRILLQNGWKPDLLDEEGNNALHLSAKHDASQVSQVLLSESSIDPKAPNSKGKCFLHLVAFHGEDNAVQQMSILQEYCPDYPINEQDLDGNTPLLIAYMNGQAALCVALAKAGSVLAKPNSEGITIFNLEVATKRLLHRVLDQVEKEPPWVETDRCQITEEKFSMRLRKHHCRHCGSCVCEKVSKNRLQIAKFGSGEKSMRVCDICYDVLTLKDAVKSGYAL